MEKAATSPKQDERAETTAKLRNINTNTKSRPRMAVMAIAVRILTVFSTVPSLIYSFCQASVVFEHLYELAYGLNVLIV